MVIEMYGKYDCTYITTWWLEHPCVRFLDLEEAGSCKRFKHTAAPILGKKGVLILARKNRKHGLELNHSNWIAAVIGDINRM